MRALARLIERRRPSCAVNKLTREIHRLSTRLLPEPVWICACATRAPMGRVASFLAIELRARNKAILVYQLDCWTTLRKSATLARAQICAGLGMGKCYMYDNDVTGWPSGIS